jgi:2-polyprenyl-6-methoxyphenol hydroxylase-like FAD-dependent oxidoreductase
MNDQGLRDSYEQLAHIYGAAAAVLRNDEFALQYLRGYEGARRPHLQAALQVTAQAIRLLDGGIDRELLVSLTSDIAREDLYDGAIAHTQGDRHTGYETVERLARVKRSVTDIAAPLIAELWSFAAFVKGQDPEDFARQLCLAVGMVGSALDQ